MTLILNLPPELEQYLIRSAQQRGVSVEELMLAILSERMFSSANSSHLDSIQNPYSLTNASLSPGECKLPSALEMQILQAIRAEDPRYNSNFTQTFIVPEGAKYLQFTLLDNNLGNNLLLMRLSEDLPLIY